MSALYGYGALRSDMAETERPDDAPWVPSGVDAATPSIARTYDYMIGGKDNFASDRAVGDKIKQELPGAVAIAVDNRKVLARAVRHLVEEARGPAVHRRRERAAHRRQRAPGRPAPCPGEPCRVRRQRPDRAGTRAGVAG